MLKDTVIMDTIPLCDICTKKACYDAKTIHGAWGYLCEGCFRTYGIGLGLGRGQRLISKGGVA